MHQQTTSQHVGMCQRENTTGQRLPKSYQPAATKFVTPLS